MQFIHVASVVLHNEKRRDLPAAII
jgi:hypothetical protein